MAPGSPGLTDTLGGGPDGSVPRSVYGTEAAHGRLGAVLGARGRTDLTPLAPGGPWLATTPAQARRVLTDTEHFGFPTDVSRRATPQGGTASEQRSQWVASPLDRSQVARGLEVFEHELTAVLRIPSREQALEIDAMIALRQPVARATCAAVLDAPDAERDQVADLVLGWIDALGPVIASTRNPRRWSRVRREEERARTVLEQALVRLGSADAAATATVLAAGIQVPIAAGAWLLVHLAAESGTAHPPRAAVWETLRLTPPTWVTARITREPVELDGQQLPAGVVVLVSPLLLGHNPDLVPHGHLGLEGFDPSRWSGGAPRPGAWLPFGTGPHACPGRNLGLALLTSLAEHAGTFAMTLGAEALLDQSRGIAPRPALLHLAPLPPSTQTESARP